MHKPKLAPRFQACLSTLFSKERKELGEPSDTGCLDEKGVYIHWDKLRFKSHPNGMDSKDWWSWIKLARKSISSHIVLPSSSKKEIFHWCEPSQIKESLHWLDIHAAGSLGARELISNPQTRNTYLFRSLVEESISSSQLEGAATTIAEAKEMIRTNREPNNTDEQMVINNYQAMNFIREMKGETLTPEIVLELHTIVTKNTLDDPEKAGCLRIDSDDVRIADRETGDVLYYPPPVADLNDQLAYLCDFANSKMPEEFVHPVIRAIITHFLIAWIHPFVDGNGRTARALFYWVMQRNGYWLMEYITISKIIKRASRQYGIAFLHTETDENDMTYFILHQLKVLSKAVTELQGYLDNKQVQLSECKQMIAQNQKLKKELNFRQLALLMHAIDHPRHAYRIFDHMRSHGITYETARKDLLQMTKLKLLSKAKQGKTFIFPVPRDLQLRLKG